MNDLKCCPFCGGEVVISDEKIDATREVYNFHCHNCDMVTFYDFPNDKEKAIETWNTRTPMANIVEKLEELPYKTNYSDYVKKGIVYKYLERNSVLNIVKQEINNGLE